MPVPVRKTNKRKQHLTGIKELDHVLGGGLVEGSSTLVVGDPGVGKTTLMIQMLGFLAASGKKVLFVSAEQSVDDIRFLIKRLGIISNIDYMSTGDVYAVTEHAEKSKVDVLVVDSLQTYFVSDVPGDVGLSRQVAAVANWLTSFAKVTNIATMIVGHRCKDGRIAGPQLVEHVIDTILHLDYIDLMKDGSPEQGVRRISIGGKHRHGPSDISAFVQMTEGGFVSLSDAMKKLVCLDP